MCPARAKPLRKNLLLIDFTNYSSHSIWIYESGRSRFFHFSSISLNATRRKGIFLFHISLFVPSYFDIGIFLTVICLHAYYRNRRSSLLHNFFLWHVLPLHWFRKHGVISE